MKFSKRFAGAVAGTSLLIGAVGAGAVFAQQPNPPAAPPAAQQQQQTAKDDQTQEPAYTGSITVPESQQEGQSEADEAAALQALAKISTDEAKAAAVAADAGTAATKAELENENGTLVYAVTLSNGVEVKVDAGNGKILATEQADQQDEKDNHGTAEHEDGGQTNEAPEAAEGVSESGN